MPRCRRFAAGVALVLAPLGLRPSVVHAGDPKPASAPLSEAERAALLARADTLDARMGEAWQAGKLAEATALAREELAIRERVLGPDHVDVATNVNNLAEMLRLQGEFREARPLYERALAIAEKTAGGDSAEVGVILNNLGFLLTRLGARAEARPLLERALAIVQKVHGPEHADVATALVNLATVYDEDGEDAKARTLYERGLAIQEKALGADHPDVAATLDSLASCLIDLGAYAEALARYERALSIRERSFGADHPMVAQSLNNLATLLEKQGVFAKARAAYDRALSIVEKSLGPEHPWVAITLKNIARLLQMQGNYKEGRRLLDRALAIEEKVLGKNHVDVARTLSNLGVLLHTQGAYEEARADFERALAIIEAAYGQDGAEVSVHARNLAAVLQAEGRYVEARRLFERALAIDEHALGEDHPDLASSLLHVSTVLMLQGEYSSARERAERALAIREKAFGKDDRRVGDALRSLAQVLEAEGSYREARPLCERALAIHERALGKDHPLLGMDLLVLAHLFMSQGAYREARPFVERGLAIDEKAVGREHPDVATDLGALAEILRQTGDRAGARTLLERTLAIYVKAYGGDHPFVASGCNNLALLLVDDGRIDDARPLFERALAIREAALGKDHPDVARSVTALAVFLGDHGESSDAFPRFERALAMTEAHARAQLSALDARQRLSLLRSTRGRLDAWIRFSPKVGRSGFPEVLRFQGLVGRAEAAERMLSRRAGVDDRRTLESLDSARRRVAGLANDVPRSFDPKSRAAWQRDYAEACATCERLTLELTKRVAPLRAALERLDLGVREVQAQLGPESALVDFLRVQDRYLAWIVRAKGEPVRVDVGAADAIEKASADFVEAITKDQDARDVGAALRRLVWAPVDALLGVGVHRVVICPDAALAAVPFAALPGGAAGRFLLDDLSISYVMNAQDLVPRKDAPPAGRGALVVGGVDFDHADVGAKSVPGAERPSALASVDRAPRGDTFAPIPQTKIEAQALRDRFGKDATTLLLGASATESRVREASKGKRFVHVATHGFAREDLLAGLYTRKIEESFVSADAERQLAVGHDPMLLSGLALAGANPRKGASGDDGVLTALEASYLDLDGVDLVTLSACETARGTPESGEGVQGLVQAFQMAGARGVVASLWRVDDEGTRRLMDGLYERLLRPGSPLAAADALREAALALRDSKDAAGTARFTALRYWAAFVSYGR